MSQNNSSTKAMTQTTGDVKGLSEEELGLQKRHLHLIIKPHLENNGKFSYENGVYLTGALEKCHAKIDTLQSQLRSAAAKEAVLHSALRNSGTLLWVARGAAQKLRAQLYGRVMYGAAEVDNLINNIDDMFASGKETNDLMVSASPSAQALIDEVEGLRASKHGSDELFSDLTVARLALEDVKKDRDAAIKRAVDAERERDRYATDMKMAEKLSADGGGWAYDHDAGVFTTYPIRTAKDTQ